MRLFVPCFKDGTPVELATCKVVTPSLPVVATIAVETSIAEFVHAFDEYFIAHELYITDISSALNTRFHIPTSSIQPLKQSVLSPVPSFKCRFPINKLLDELNVIVLSVFATDIFPSTYNFQSALSYVPVI